ncbi:thioredoxin reductase (NADPH) [Glaciihabitans tibetensis]|uniref:Thioredoxin reductase (NADPH) n=1 Tax=Glaciihabitans tibetensis TaxID=1266600 RepID=A0A2T0VEH6_9MICO|nr:FAD-dependent oxidoreductase [Glaciihabitans tibetensis]PRY68577.1 thioredoxin reductase (NADPH) [Glaciihabitans tibetensis]
MTEPAPSSLPLIVLSAGSATARSLVAGQLQRRYPADYRIVVAANPANARATLDQAGAEHQQLALLLSDGDEPLFAAARRLFPDSRRGLLIDWGSWSERSTARRVLELMATNHIDSYVVTPRESRDEGFHRTVTELLHEWERAAGALPGGRPDITVAGHDALPRTHEIRRFLSRATVPFESVTLNSAASPNVRLGDGRVLVAPDNTQLATAIGLDTSVPTDELVDLAIVGAGPAGLAAAVYAASEGLNTLVVERDAVGGQAGSSSLIRNYLGFSRGVSGADLSQRAYQQAWTFGARFAHTREVIGMSSERDWFALRVSPEDTVRARSVVLATGVTYRRLSLAGLEPWVGSAVFYGVSAVEAKAQAGRIVHVVGGGNSAGQAALHLARYASSVTIIVRGASLAESMSQYLIDQLTAAGVVIATEAKVVGGGGSNDGLDHLVVRNRQSGADATVRSDALFITIGAAPHTQWLPDEILRDQWGFVLTGNDVLAEGGRRAWPHSRPPAALESSVPGVFAVGDVRRASVKRVANAVGEGSVVVSAVHAFLAERVPAG